MPSINLLIFYFHLFWFFLIVLLTFMTLSFLLFLLITKTSLYLSISFVANGFISLPVTFYFDINSLIFSFIILLISTLVIVYSYSYIYPYSTSSLFLFLTFLFVFSILLVVNISSLLFLILGWDGLGLVSFFLIVYYQNSASLYSGLFTLLINRLGDCFFILSIVVMYVLCPSLSLLNSDYYLYLSFILILTFMTKSAIFPFSPWLPIAMAAPTPISALVHSSTLVTSGLFLIIRFSPLLYASYNLILLLSLLCIFTSFYAGINCIFECDLNKMIALSTLSHLGFIGFSFSLGLLDLAFFHLLVHALFNSLLFMSIGDIMTNMFHSQDIRYLSLGSVQTPFSVFIINTSLLNLLGLPILSGFYSNDLVLEHSSYSNLSVLLAVLLFLNVFFTYYYTYKLLSYSFSLLNHPPYNNPSSYNAVHVTLLAALSIFSVSFSYFYLYSVSNFMQSVCVPEFLKFLPIFINFLVFTYLLIFLKFSPFKFPQIYSYFSSIIYLYPCMSSISSSSFLNFNLSLVKSVEFGPLNYLLNVYSNSLLSGLSLNIINMTLNSPINLVFFSFIFIVGFTLLS